jgi:hypothetical protein
MMAEIIHGKFGMKDALKARKREIRKEATDRFFEETERRLLLEYVTLTVTYKEDGSVTDELIEEVTGPPNHAGSGFGKRDMGWVFPKEDIKTINAWVPKLQALTGVSIDINVTDADGNPN